MSEFEPKEHINDLSEFKLTPDTEQKEVTVSESDSPPVSYAIKAKDYEDSDFHTARKNILDVVNHGSSVLHSMINLAEVSDHPRAWEVVATIMKTLTESNKDLIDLHEKKAKLNPIVPENQTNIQNNSLHVGTTAELLELLKNGDKKDDENKPTD